MNRIPNLPWPLESPDHAFNSPRRDSSPHKKARIHLDNDYTESIRPHDNPPKKT